MSPDKPPVNIFFKIAQSPEPNSHWYRVTATLSWGEDSYDMKPALCLQDRVNKIKEAICFLVEEQFTIHNIHEVKVQESSK